MFKFYDFLTPEEQEALNKLREKLGGRNIYIRYPEPNQYRLYLNKRNARIRKMFVRLKKLGLSESVIYAEISIRLSCAKGLSESHIRKIVKGYLEKRSQRSEVRS
jgi:Mor family transcriptional regulator